MILVIVVTRHPGVCGTHSRVSGATNGQFTSLHKSGTSDISLLCRVGFPRERGVATREYVFYDYIRKVTINCLVGS